MTCPALFRVILLFFLSFGFIDTSAQHLTEAQYIDQQELEANVKVAVTPRERIIALLRLYFHHKSHSESFNREAAIQLERQLEIEANNAGDPSLVCFVSSNLALYAPATPENDEVRKLLDRAISLARLHKLPDQLAIAKTREGWYYAGKIGNTSKALQSINESNELLSQIPDTLRIDLLSINAETCNVLNDYSTALRYLTDALDRSWRIKDYWRVGQCEVRIAALYRYVGDYSKSELHYKEALKAFQKNGQKRHEVRVYNGLARIYILSEQWNLAEHYMQKAFQTAADVRGTKRIFNQISGELISALTDKKHAPLLRSFLKQYRKNFFISPRLEFTDNFTLALAYHIIGEKDSASKLLQKAVEVRATRNTLYDDLRFLHTAGTISLSQKKYDDAQKYFIEGLNQQGVGNETQFLISFADSLKNISLILNKPYDALRYDVISDSLRTALISKQNAEELMRQEVAGFEAQRTREIQEAEERRNQRNNLQYLGITAAIVALFLSLLIMGIFRVSAKTVRILGFFSFLLFFEFIFLVFKKKVSVITGGEPLKDLAFMVALAAVMVPLHHWAEHRAIHFLTNHKLNFRKRKQEDQDSPTSATEIREVVPTLNQ